MVIPLSRIDAFLRKGMGQEQARERSPFGLAFGRRRERESSRGRHPQRYVCLQCTSPSGAASLSFWDVIAVHYTDFAPRT